MFKILVFLVSFFSAMSYAQDYSLVIPQFVEAVDGYVNAESLKQFEKQDTVIKIIKIFEKNKISKSFLQKRFNHFNKKDFLLPAPDQYDSLISNSSKEFGWRMDIPKVALHAFRLDVENASDDWFKDDLYMYFFITDGVIPTGKVTSIYKGLAGGESLMFNEVDRAIFPLNGISAKAPSNHLIVDYGLIESDGDDITEMKKLTSIIVDIAITVYTAYDPNIGQVLAQLRREIKALADLLIELNHDDRLFVDTLAFKSEELQTIFSQSTFYELNRTYKNNATMNSWKYKLHFRLLKE